MHQGIPLQSLAEKLIYDVKTKRDFLVTANKLDMILAGNGVVTSGSGLLDQVIANTERRPGSVDYALRFGDFNAFPMLPLSHSQIQEFCKIPKPYYDRCMNEAPALLIENVQHWLRNSDATRMIRTLDGRTRAFLSDRYRPIDNMDLFKAIYPTIQKSGAIVKSCQVTDTRLYVKATSPSLRIPITTGRKVGDIIEAGVMVQNSEVGMGRVVVGPFLVVLSCTNGNSFDKFATKRTHLGKRMGRGTGNLEDQVSGPGAESGGIADEWFSDDTKKLDDAAFFSKVQDTVKACFDEEQVRKIQETIDDSTKREIDAPIPAVVKEVANKFNLSDETEAKLLQELIKGADLTQWGLAQAVTAHAGKVDDYDSSTDLEKLGGQIIELNDNGWESLLRDAKKAA